MDVNTPGAGTRHHLVGREIGIAVVHGIAVPVVAGEQLSSIHRIADTNRQERQDNGYLTRG
jgi:hypothetical protein